MARTCVLAALTILLGATSGCVTSDTLIKLNPDGSGIVVQKTLMSTEVISQLTAMMQGFAQQMTGNQQPQQEPKMPELFNEKDARSRASKMGEGVSFVSSRKIKQEGMEGQEATYAFSDVTKLKLSEKPETPSVPGLKTKSSGSGRRDYVSLLQTAKWAFGIDRGFWQADIQESLIRRDRSLITRAQQINQGTHR